MKRTLKKSMSSLLAFTLLFGSLVFGFSDVIRTDLVVNAEATEKFTSGYFTYTVDEKGVATIIACDDSVGNKVVIPEEIDGYPVKIIFSAFKDLDISEITIPATVSEFKGGLFYDYNHLIDVYYLGTLADWCEITFDSHDSNPLYYVNDFLVDGVLVKEIIIPNIVEKINPYSFYNLKQISKIYIPDSVTEIGYAAFGRCTNLNEVTIGKSVIKIDATAFNNCDSIKKVYYRGNISEWCEIDFVDLDSSPLYYSSSNSKTTDLYINNVLIEGNIEIPEGTQKIGNAAFYGCDEITSVSIPVSVKFIGRNAFYNCTALTKVEIPYGITNISYSAFNKTGIKSVVIPDTVTNIEGWAFAYCENLSDVYYTGSEEEWNEITIGRYNEALTGATIHYNYIVGDDPTTEPVTPPEEVTTIPEKTTVPTTTEPEITEPLTTESVEVPTTTKPVELPTTKPVVTEPSTVKPTEVTTTKPATTKPSTTEPTKPIETTGPATEPITKLESVEEEFIKKPSTSTVKYGETLILHVDFENIPADTVIEWSVDGEGVTIKPSADGLTCAVTSTATGDVTITAKYTDANGVEHVSEQEIESNASFWQKIVSFFKNLFGINRIIEQVIKF